MLMPYCSAQICSILQPRAFFQPGAKYAQKYMDKWAEKYGPEAAARIAEIVLKD